MRILSVRYVYVTLIRYVTLRPIDLESLGYIKHRVIKVLRYLSEIEQIPAELLKIWQIFAHVISRCDLDL